MDKQLIELAVTLFGKAAKNLDNKVKKTYKESDFTPAELAEATSVRNELTRLEPTPNPGTAPRSIHKSESQLTNGLSAEIEHCGRMGDY